MRVTSSAIANWATRETDSEEAESGPRTSEAFEMLSQMAARSRSTRIPAEWLARHVMRLYGGEGDWPLQRGAMEAVLRRLQFARRDELRVAQRPARGRPLGAYATRRSRESARPYHTVLERLEPLAASCDCADFIGGSLGLCKHVLVVVEELASKPKRWQRAADGDALELPPQRLTWDPVRPLRGPGDSLDRVRFVAGPTAAKATKRGPRGAGRAAKWLAQDPDDDQGTQWPLKATYVDDPPKRLALVKDLQAFGRQRPANRDLDPALVAMLAHERDRLARITAAQIAPKERQHALRSLRRKLYPYQKEGVERFLAEGRLLLADDMGLGKTAQAVAACHVLWATRRVTRGLLVVPASLKHQWAREWERFSDAPVEVVEGGPEERAAIYERWRKGFLIVNYEQVLRDLSQMRAWDPHVAVLDEAQRIKNWASKTAGHIKALTPRYRLVLTGTPFENRLEELASVMDWVDPHALQPKWRLEPWHTMYGDGKQERMGVRNLDTLRQRLSHCMVRRQRPEILDQLPPRTDTMVPVELTDAQRDEHDELVEPIAKLVRAGKRRPLTQAEFLRLMSLLTTQRIIANGIAQLRFSEIWPGIEGIRRPDDALLSSLAAPKLRELRELIARIAVEQGRKVVIFSQWRRMLRLAQWALRDVLGDAGLRSVFFTGQEGTRRRQHNIVDLHDDPSVRVLLATDAGGVGLNLQRACTCCINLDLPWNPAVLEQRVGRIYRLEQTEPVDVFNLVSQRCIEARIATLVNDKKAIFRGLFDGDTDEVRFDESGSFLAGVERLVDAESLPGTSGGDASDEISEDETSDAEGRAATEEALDALGDGVDDIEEETGEAQTEERGRATEDEPATAARTEADQTTRTEEPASANTVREALSRMRVERTSEGGMRIEAPPESADTLATLFEQMSQLLREQARPPES